MAGLSGISAASRAQLLLSLALIFGTSRSSAQVQPPDPLAVDHVIVGASELASGIRELGRLTGVTARPGGRHPGRGTQNALLSLGPSTYLELAAPSGEPDSSGMAAYLAGLTHLTPAGWALASHDLPATIARLRASGVAISGPFPGSREQPDGSLLQWTTARLDADSTGLAPFLIQWDAGSQHPAKSSPSGCTLQSIELRTQQPQTLRHLLTTLGVAAVVVEGPQPGIRITLACSTGRVVLGD
jgi:hypothetical protein